MTTREDVHQLGLRLSNWGRWGTEDQLGTLNLITAERRQEAAAELRTGQAFCLALPFDSNGPQTGAFGRFNPIHVMLRDGGDIASGAIARFYGGTVGDMCAVDDIVTMPLQCSTQWDGLAHVFHRGRMYNGHGAEEVSSLGAHKNGIEYAAACGIIGRGVLLDVPRLRGAPWLEAGEPVTASDLDAAATRQAVEIREGDILLVRTGQIAEVRARGSWGDYAGGDAPGLALDALSWIREKGLAAIATDTYGAEVRPEETTDMGWPFHAVAIAHMGLTIGEMFDLETLAESCEADRCSSFLFSAPPLPITGAVGSPINPVAVK